MVAVIAFYGVVLTGTGEESLRSTPWLETNIHQRNVFDGQWIFNANHACYWPMDEIMVEVYDEDTYEGLGYEERVPPWYFWVNTSNVEHLLLNFDPKQPMEDLYEPYWCGSIKGLQEQLYTMAEEYDLDIHTRFFGVCSDSGTEAYNLSIACIVLTTLRLLLSCVFARCSPHHDNNRKCFNVLSMTVPLGCAAFILHTYHSECYTEMSGAPEVDTRERIGYTSMWVASFLLIPCILIELAIPAGVSSSAVNAEDRSIDAGSRLTSNLCIADALGGCAARARPVVPPADDRMRAREW